MEVKEIEKYMNLLEGTLALASEKAELGHKLQHAYLKPERETYLRRLKEIDCQVSENTAKIEKFRR